MSCKVVILNCIIPLLCGITIQGKLLIYCLLTWILSVQERQDKCFAVHQLSKHCWLTSIALTLEAGRCFIYLKSQVLKNFFFKQAEYKRTLIVYQIADHKDLSSQHLTGWLQLDRQILRTERNVDLGEFVVGRGGIGNSSSEAILCVLQGRINEKIF